MEIVLRNDVGDVISTHRFYGVDPAVAIECQHWVLSPGDTIEIRSEEINESEIYEDLEHKVNDCLHEFQKRYDIENGDIDPIQMMKLNAEMRALAGSIGTILYAQRQGE